MLEMQRIVTANERRFRFGFLRNFSPDGAAAPHSFSKVGFPRFADIEVNPAHALE